MRNNTKHNYLLCMLSMQCISYSSVLKTQLEMFSKCAQYEFKLRAIFCLRKFNFANFLKSRSLMLAKISKNKVFTTVSLPDPALYLQVLFVQPQLPLGLKMQ